MKTIMRSQRWFWSLDYSSFHSNINSKSSGTCGPMDHKVVKENFMYYKPTKSDWKLFQEKLPEWQEAFMDKLNHEYIEILNGDGQPSDRFWNLDDRIKKDKRLTGVVCRDMEKSNMFEDIMSLIAEKAISADDLSEFSDELQTAVKARIDG